MKAQREAERDAEPAGAEDRRLQRVAELLREIEEEAMRLVEGARGASALAIVSRAASARRQLGDVLEQEPGADPVLVQVEAGYLRRIRAAIHELRLSAPAAANLTGVTAEEMDGLLRGSARALPLEQLERMARRLEAEQQLLMESLL